MAQPAYDLSRFAAPAPKARPRPQVKVAKRRQSETKRQLMRMVRTLLAVSLLVALVCAVLSTHSSVNELQRQIVKAEKALTEEEALYHHLSFQMDNMTSLKYIEERAAAMGMEKVTGNQTTYFRVEDGSQISVKENPITRLINSVRSGFLDIMADLVP